jgi:hypothetical protein
LTTTGKIFFPRWQQQDFSDRLVEEDGKKERKKER